MASLELLPPIILTLFVLIATAQSSPPPPPPPPQSLVNAADTLANSGYTAMSLTLQIIAPTLPLPNTNSNTITALTIFCPPDESFASSGQPSLALLLLHFSPLSLSPTSLLSLPFTATIPSLSPYKNLTVTSNQAKRISINSVGISENPIFDDGSVIVYGIDDFFDLNFTLTLTNSTEIYPKSDFQCQKLETVSRFKEASRVLKSRGCSIMASFLDLQLVGFLHNGGFSEDVVKWTVFAPVDEQLEQFSGDFFRYCALFMRHLAPCKVGWSDLEAMVNGTVIFDNVKGFSLEITRDEYDEILMVNGVEITFPDMYDSEWLVIHGIQGVIALPDSAEEETEVMEEFPAGN